MSNFSGTQSSTSFVPPTYQTAFNDQQSLSDYAAMMAQYMFSWAQSTYANLNALTDQTFQEMMQAGAQAMKLAGNMTERYMQKYQPQEDAAITQANQLNSPEYQQYQMGQAGATTAQGMEASHQAAITALQGMGIDPSAGRYAGLLEAEAAQRGAAVAGAENQAQVATRAQGIAARQAVINTGMQYPASIANSLNSAINAYTGATNAKLATAQVGAQLMSVPNAYLGTAMSLKYPPLGQSSSSQQQAHPANPAQSKQNAPGANQDTGYHGTVTNPGGGKDNSVMLDMSGKPKKPDEDATQAEWDAWEQQAQAWEATQGPYDTTQGANQGQPEWGSVDPTQNMPILGDQTQGNTSFTQNVDQAGQVGTLPGAGQPFTPYDPSNPVPNQDQAGFQSPDISGMDVQQYDPQTGFQPVDQGGLPANAQQTSLQADPFASVDSGTTYGSDPFANASGQQQDPFAQQQQDQFTPPFQDNSPSYQDPNANSYDPNAWDYQQQQQQQQTDYSQNTGDYARGGAVRRYDQGGALPGLADQPVPMQPMGGQTQGGQVPQGSAQPGVPGPDNVNAMLTEGEFVVPHDVAKWKGEEFFQKLIQQSRKNRMQAPAAGQPGRQAPGPVGFSSQPTGRA
jgi:hypothetical protein